MRRIVFFIVMFKKHISYIHIYLSTNYSKAYNYVKTENVLKQQWFMIQYV